MHIYSVDVGFISNTIMHRTFDTHTHFPPRAAVRSSAGSARSVKVTEPSLDAGERQLL